MFINIVCYLIKICELIEKEVKLVKIMEVIDCMFYYDDGYGLKFENN